ncbi:MAG: hypothetical protein ACI9NT_000048 [Bacteroidia bacterium]|jgi:uncharacterized protein YgfB (UPF0149 family)
MHEESSEEVGVFDFDELADHLVEQGLAVSPAQLHGCLTGQLCAGAASTPEVGLNGLSESLDVIVYGELAERLLQLYAITAAALADEEFSFHLLLPDDETDIDQRTESLGAWCQGFLTGFAHVSVDQGLKSDGTPEEIGEILRDVAAIAEAGVDEDETEDESEGSYTDLVEYLRFACINVFMEVSSETLNGDTGARPSLH